MSFSATIARVDELLAQIDPPATTPVTASTAASADATAAATGAGTSAGAFADQLARSTAGSASLPENAQRFQPMVARAARYWGVDPDVINAVIEHESRFEPGATNPTSGAAGLMQLMPATAKGLGVTNPYDPAQNIWGGAHLLSTQLQHFHGDLRLALAAYSAGAGAVEHYGGVPPYAETTQFVNWMMTRVAQLKGEST